MLPAVRSGVALLAAGLLALPAAAWAADAHKAVQLADPLDGGTATRTSGGTSAGIKGME